MMVWRLHYEKHCIENNDLTPLSADEFESRLRDIGKERYHDNCKFHHLLHSGKLNKDRFRPGL